MDAGKNQAHRHPVEGMETGVRVNTVIPPKTNENMSTATKSFHSSALGMFGHNLPTDQDGYVHLTPEGWLSAPMDWGPGWDEESKATEAKQMAEEAIEMTAVDEAALEEWRAR